VYQIEKSITDFGEKITDDDKAKLEPRINDLKEALKGEDIERIKSLKEELMKEAQLIFGRIYQEQGQAAEQPDVSGGGSAADSGGDNVVDADFEE
jgi:molecular chaperone DnaK